MTKRPMTTLGNLAEVNPPLPVHTLGEDALVSFIPMEDVSEDARWTHRQVRPLGRVRRGYTAFAEGDVLVAKITPCLENGKGCHAVGLTGGVGFGTTEFHVLRARAGINARFIYHLTIDAAFRVSAEGQMTGSAGQQRVPTSFLRLYSVPTFSSPEQDAIAETLDAADAQIERAEAGIAKRKRVRTGLLQDLLARGLDADGQRRDEATHAFQDTPLGRAPAEWDVLTLADIGRWLSGGTPAKSEPAYWDGAIPWVTPKDMKVLNLSKTTDALTERGLSGSRLAPAESVMVVVRGMILAHTFPVCLTSRPMAFNQDVKALVANTRATPIFLANWFRARDQHLLSLTTTSTHGTKRLDMEELLAERIALPSPAEQRRIVAVLDAADAEIAREEAALAKLRRLKAGLMQDLLTGRVPVRGLLAQAPLA